MNKYINFTDIIFTEIGKNEFKPTPIFKLASNLEMREHDLKMLQEIKPMVSDVKRIVFEMSSVLKHEIRCINNKIRELEVIAKDMNAENFFILNKMPRFQDKEKITDDNMFDKSEIKSFTVETKNIV